MFRRSLAIKLVALFFVIALGLFGYYASLNVHIPNLVDPHSAFFAPILNHPIKSPSLKGTYQDTKAREIFADRSDLLSKDYLLSCIDIPDLTLTELTDNHQKYVEFLKSDKNNIDTFTFIKKGSKEWKSYKGLSGVMFIGGGKYSWLSLLSIIQLRKTGSKVPVELFIPSKEEYEPHFCDVVMPKYDARCVVFENPVPEELLFKVKGYQYKMLALLTSSFENTLYMDSDLFPLRNIDYLFESDVYKKNGLVLWPDAWARTTNPKFYDIAGVKVSERKVRHSIHDQKNGRDSLELADGNFQNSDFHTFENTIPNPTVEAGVILVNKSTHKKTLQLALYYNIHGPDFYYPLLTQGSAGEGDKETFNAAAHVLNEPYFLTPKLFSWIGYHHKEDNLFTSKALGIHDPVEAARDPEKKHLLLLHCSYPKYFPEVIVNQLIYSKLGDHIRMYEGTYEDVGYDVDLRLLEIYTECFCEHYKPDASTPSTYKNLMWANHYNKYILDETKRFADSCERVFIPHLEWLRDTTKYPDTNK